MAARQSQVGGDGNAWNAGQIKKKKGREMKMKNIYLVRHGKALGTLYPKGVEEIKATAAKIQSEIGRAYVQQMMEEGRKVIIKYNYNELIEKYEIDWSNHTGKVEIFHSPLERAKESAEIIAGFFKPGNVHMEAKDELSCNSYQVHSIVDIIESTGIIISHQPDLMDYLGRIGAPGIIYSGDYKKI